MATIETPLGVRLPDFIPHWPHAPQEAFLWLDCLEALYGGAAGGGKSDALLMAALQYADIPGYAALILRKTFADLNLPGAIMDRSKTWLAGTAAKWNDNEKQWRFPSSASITFGYLQTTNDKFRYQGAEFQFIGFDELTQFDEADYSYLLSRLRRPAEGQLTRVPLRMRAASNPGGRGHKWVKRRFIDRQPNPEDVEDTPVKCDARVFVPARLDDNPSVDQDSYAAALGGLDPQTRQQLLNGDWNTRPPGDWVYDQAGIDAAEATGALLDAQLRAGTIPPPSGEDLAVGIDWGEHTHALTIWPLEAGGIYIPPCEVVSASREPGEVTGDILEQALRHGHPLGEARYDAAGVQSMRTFAATARPIVPALKTVSVPFGKFKMDTIGYLRMLFRRAGEGHATRVIAVSPANVELLRQLRGLQFADEDEGRIAKGDDHGPDALIAGAAPVAHRHRTTTTR